MMHQGNSQGINEMGDLIKDVKENLENRGVLANIRAQLRAEVFAVIRNVEQEAGEERPPSAKAIELQKTSRGQLAVELVRDFLEKYGCLMALSLFKSEAKLPETPIPIDELCKEAGVQLQQASGEEGRLLAILSEDQPPVISAAPKKEEPSNDVPWHAHSREQEAAPAQKEQQPPPVDLPDSKDIAYNEPDNGMQPDSKDIAFNQPGNGIQPSLDQDIKKDYEEERDPLSRTIKPDGLSKLIEGDESETLSSSDVFSNEPVTKEKKKKKKKKDKKKHKEKKLGALAEPGDGRAGQPVLGTLSKKGSPLPGDISDAAHPGSLGKDGFQSPADGQELHGFQPEASPFEQSDSFAQSSLSASFGGREPDLAPLGSKLGPLSSLGNNKLGKLSKLDPLGGAKLNPLDKPRLPKSSSTESDLAAHEKGFPPNLEESFGYDESFRSDLSSTRKLSALDLGASQENFEVSRDLSEMSFDESNDPFSSKKVLDDKRKLKALDAKIEQMESEDPSLSNLRKKNESLGENSKGIISRPRASVGWGEEDAEDDLEPMPVKKAPLGKKRLDLDQNFEETYDDDDIEFVENQNLQPGRSRKVFDPLGGKDLASLPNPNSNEEKWGQRRDPPEPIEKKGQQAPDDDDEDAYSDDYEDDDFEKSIAEEMVIDDSLEISTNDQPVQNPNALESYHNIENVM